ncbi:M57 family metalloprotease [Spirosoma sp. 209]|uniref:M57 family metalloprotease n=1 Tax=Spirosoma sp. 209 TaxID=1955701 RepID=UPI00098D0812|nr:M57 family metalloprotease [Spirosoma sp. 209]
MQKCLPATSWLLTGLLAVSLLLANGCQPVSDPLAPQVNSSGAVRAYIRSLGCPDSLIEDKGDHFIADGDMLFNKNMPLPANGAQEEQAYESLNQLIYNGKAQERVWVYIHPELIAPGNKQYIPGIVDLVTKATTQWNNAGYNPVTKSNLVRTKFYITKNNMPGVVHIVRDEAVTTGMSYGPYATGSPPSLGHPGELLIIHYPKFKMLLHKNQIAALTHEFGHCLGLVHTDWKKWTREIPGLQIPGSPAVDNASIMNRTPTATAPSAADINTLRTLYPATVYNIKLSVVNKPNSQKAFSISLNGPVHHIKGFLFRYYINHKVISNGTLAYNPTYGTGEQGYSYAPKPAPAANQYTLETRQIQTYGSDITYKQTWYLQFNVRIRYADGTLGPWLAQDQKFTGEFK